MPQGSTHVRHWARNPKLSKSVREVSGDFAGTVVGKETLITTRVVPLQLLWSPANDK